jgi:CheY-like chemotaxis protein
LKVNAIAIQQAEQEQKLIQDETTIKPLTKTIKVLVAEDVALNQLLIKIILMDFGFEFDIAENGKIAIELLQKIKYDIILMDLQMPEMNGFELLDALQELPADCIGKMAIYIITSSLNEKDVRKSKEYPILKGYIGKPLSFEQVKEVINFEKNR